MLYEHLVLAPGSVELVILGYWKAGGCPLPMIISVIIIPEELLGLINLTLILPLSVREGFISSCPKRRPNGGNI